MNPTLRKTLIVLAVAGVPVVLFAQGAPDASSVLTNVTGLSVQAQLYLTWFSMALKYLGEFYSSLRAGGGLKRIIMSMWLGEQAPKVVLDDYKKELTTPPFTPPSQ